MDYSAKELLLHPGERKPTSYSTCIIQVVLAMLIITACVVLLVAPTAFVTLFVFESFQSKSVERLPIKSSILMSKLLPQVNDEALDSKSTMESEEILINVPDAKIDQLLDQLDISSDPNQEPKNRFKRSSGIEKLSTKDIKRLIELLNSIQYHGKRAEDISEEDQNKLNHLMDRMGMRKKRDTRPMDDSFDLESEDKMIFYDDHSVYMNKAFQESTLYRLLRILDNLQNGGMDLEDIDDYDSDTLNYFMDLEGL